MLCRASYITTTAVFYPLLPFPFCFQSSSWWLHTSSIRSIKHPRRRTDQLGSGICLILIFKRTEIHTVEEESNRRSDPRNDIPSHGESYPLYAFAMSISETNYRLKLSKEDESSNSEENEVRREDQEKINRFSSLHQRELVLEQLLKGKQVYISPFFFFFSRCCFSVSTLHGNICHFHR